MVEGGILPMTEQTLLATPSLYELDETAWLEKTAALIGQQRFGEIDHAQLSEYLSDMARRDKREVLSRLTALLAHLLKWEYQPDHKTNSWQITILHQRNELRDMLESRTLENHARTILAKAYERALQQAALETGTEEAAFPAVCPWSLEEVVPEE
jgi:Domain of unknown function DUF29